MIITTYNTRDCLLFDPTSHSKAVWETLGLFMILYQAIVIPFRLCFEAEAAGFAKKLEDVIDICFIADIFVQFNSGYFSKGKVVN